MTSTVMNRKSNDLMPPHEAIASIIAELSPVETQLVTLKEAIGRVLAEPLRADRPSLPCDVSAMDGYALRYRDARPGTVAVKKQVFIGQTPPVLPSHSAMRIFTGCAIPPGAELVIPREQVTESGDAIIIAPGVTFEPGANIRRMGENLRGGEVVVDVGEVICPAVCAALATFGHIEPLVYRSVRISLLTTGNEVLPPHATPQLWQLRDSNGPFLRSFFALLPWLRMIRCEPVADDPTAVRSALEAALADSDAVILTGGVSMGDHDYVPDAVRQIGGHIVFHRLAIRPGKPTLGAIGPKGQAILGLPGNPVAVMTTARLLALPVLRRRAGFVRLILAPPVAQLRENDGRSLGLWWYRPVRRVAPGIVELVPSMGSGDVVSAARADGFVEVPPGETGVGPLLFYAWSGVE